MERTAVKGAILLIIALVMSGCATSSGYIPLQNVSLDEAGKTVVTVGGYTKDASVAKEHEIMETFRNRDNNRRMMHAASGFTMDYKVIKLNGVEVPMPIVSFRELPNFEQALPTEPSKHPVWEAATSMVGTIAKYGMIGWGISEVSGVIKAGYDAAGHSFTNSAVNHSFNTAGQDQNFTGGPQYNGPYNHASGEESSDWASIPGCSSYESYMEGKCSVQPE